jgi:hypothetical protein
MMESKFEKSSSLVQRVLANLEEDLKEYEEPNFGYELFWYFYKGELPIQYRVVRTLAVGAKVLRHLTRER